MTVTSNCLVIDALKTEIQTLEKRLHYNNLDFISYIDFEEQTNKCNEYGVLLIQSSNQINAQMLDSLPQLRYIISRSSGLDHIDSKAAEQRNIQVKSLGDYSKVSVAEFTITQILYLAKNIKQLKGKITIESSQISKHFGIDIKGKTLGIIGTGHIGKRVGKSAKALKMNVIAYSRTVDKAYSEKYGIPYVTLNELLKESDIITLHVSLTTETHHLINKKAIEKMKDGAILINTARGSVVDTAALIKGLETGKISQCALDMVEEKHANHPIISENDNVLLTPHFACGTHDTFNKWLNRTISIANEVALEILQ